RHEPAAQRVLPAVRGRRERHGPALHHHRHAAGPEQRGRPVVRARERADAREPPAPQPVPEHRRAGPAARVRGGQRDLRPGPHRPGQRPGQPGHHGGPHDAGSRPV
ncbi:MAG: hypothetical protein AVDCRST_MAG40-767, partial [uncultured Gemmatimonadaceae bacterium]